MLNIESPQAECCNLKYHREGKGEHASVPLDAKIKLTCSGKCLTPLLGRSESSAFWLDNEDKDMAFPNMGSLGINTKMQDCKLTFFPNDTGEMPVQYVNLGVFSAQVKPGGMVELTFNAAFKDPNEEITETLQYLYGSKNSFALNIAGGDLVTSSADPEPEDDEGEEEQPGLRLAE